MSITILLVDDHPVVRTGLRAVIDDRDGIVVVGEAGTGAEAVTLAEHVAPDVVLCDLRLGEGMDGVATTRALRALPHPPAVLILTTFDRDVDILASVEAGAAGYLLKDEPPEAIIDAVHTVAGGRTYLAPELASRVVAQVRAPSPRLTDRETDVLQHAARGESNREIARTLFVTEATVKSHLAHVFVKLGVDSRSRAIHVARERGIL